MSDLRSFKKKIKVYGETIEFNFTRMFTIHGVKYFITAFDKNIQPIVFNMVIKDDNWMIVPGNDVPQKIYDIQEELSKVIIEYTASLS